MTDHATLRTLAKAATPGPWVIDDSDPSDVVIRSAVDQRWVSNIGNWSRQLPMPMALDSDRLRQVYEADAVDARYLAACDPQTILALLDELETLRAALRGLLATHGGPCRLGDDCPAITMARAALVAGEGEG